MPDDQTNGFTSEFAFEKETKNTVKYTEEPQTGQPPRIGSLYIHKWAMGGNPPRRIKLSVETVN